MRSLADPTKAAVYDRVMVSSSRPELPAPVPADLIDASNDIMRTLRDWAVHVDPSMVGRRGLAAGTETAEAFEEANDCLQVILERYDTLVNRTEVVAFADAILYRHQGEPDWWSISDALAKWPLDDRERWAQNPCPECDCRTVRVVPPRRKSEPARYRCTSCAWERSEEEDDGFWAEAFADVIPEAVA
ncbi:hypothetical protein [Microbacterium sp. A1-JK]|uniref:hypothetical protein n=1 Tax=Microbacterium sp. A1-JK TaxID=3177516 RepID=UPI00388823D8